MATVLGRFHRNWLWIRELLVRSILEDNICKERREEMWDIAGAKRALANFMGGFLELDCPKSGKRPGLNTNLFPWPPQHWPWRAVTLDKPILGEGCNCKPSATNTPSTLGECMHGSWKGDLGSEPQNPLQPQKGSGHAYERYLLFWPREEGERSHSAPKACALVRGAR